MQRWEEVKKLISQRRSWFISIIPKNWRLSMSNYKWYISIQEKQFNLLLVRGQIKQCKLKQWNFFYSLLLNLSMIRRKNGMALRARTLDSDRAGWGPALPNTSYQLLKISELQINDSNCFNELYPSKHATGHRFSTLNLSFRFSLSLWLGTMYFNLNFKF